MMITGPYDLYRSMACCMNPSTFTSPNFPQATQGPWPHSAPRLKPWQRPFRRCVVSDASFPTAEDRQRLFNRIAPAYDSLNDWLSLGQHRVWKRMAVSWCGAKPGDNVLDICCGSGDLSFLLAEKVRPTGTVTGVDFAKEQLLVASERQKEKSGVCYNDIRWLQGDALNLPFTDEVFDAVTIGYGLRNVADIPRALNEIYRVLKQGSRACILDFNHPRSMFISQLQAWMLENVVVPSATQLGMREEYAYLKSSIGKFPTGAEQEMLARDAGFSHAVHYELANGLMGALVLTR